MSHNDLVLAYLLELGGGALAIVLLVVAVMWWRQGQRARRLGPAVALVMCLASVGVSAHCAAYLAHARTVLCTPGATRALCPNND